MPTKCTSFLGCSAQGSAEIESAMALLSSAPDGRDIAVDGRKYHIQVRAVLSSAQRMAQLIYHQAMKTCDSGRPTPVIGCRQFSDGNGRKA